MTVIPALLTASLCELVRQAVELKNVRVKDSQELLKPMIFQESALQLLESTECIPNLCVLLHDDFKSSDAVRSHLTLSAERVLHYSGTGRGILTWRMTVIGDHTQHR